MRLIDADDLEKAITEQCRSETECLNHFWYDENIIALIDNAPTVEPNQLTQDLIDKVNVNVGLAQPIKDERPQGNWGKWVISEIQCPNCFEYFQTDCYSMGELNKCPNCEAKMINEEETS